MDNIKFSYGCMSPFLEEQANEQGFTLGINKEKLEKIRISINMCRFHVAISSQAKLMFDKLNKMVVDSLEVIK